MEVYGGHAFINQFSKNINNDLLKTRLNLFYGRRYNQMIETKTTIQGETQWRNAHLITTETAEKMYNLVGVATSVNDGEYCSVSNDESLL